MSVPTRLLAFALVLGVTFGRAALAGASIDPTNEPAGAEPAAAPVPGLAVSEGGYTLESDRALFASGARSTFSFRISDDAGRAIRDEFELQHERRLHLIVVRRDTAVVEHLRPEIGPDGTWVAALREGGMAHLHVHPLEDAEPDEIPFEATFPSAGRYRLFLQFKSGGQIRPADYTIEVSR